MNTIEEAMAGFANSSATPLTDESVNDIISNFTGTSANDAELNTDVEDDEEETGDVDVFSVIRSVLSQYHYVMLYPDGNIVHPNSEESDNPIDVTALNGNGTLLRFEGVCSTNLYKFESLIEEHTSDTPEQHREGMPVYKISEFGNDVTSYTVNINSENALTELINELDAVSPTVVRAVPVSVTDTALQSDNDSNTVDTTSVASENNSNVNIERLKLEAERLESMKIPVNSNTVHIRESNMRFSSAVWFKSIQDKVVILAGVGGIGSYVAYLLARLGIRSLFMYDDDVVEMSNMAGQLYRRSDISKFKTDAMSDIISQFTTFASANSITEKFDDNSEAADIMICGFDNMVARRTFFDKWRRHVSDSKNRENCLFIDGRLSAEYLQVYCLTGEDDALIEEYGKVALFEDSEAEHEVCSYKQTSFIANMIGSIIVNLFVNFVANQCGDMRSLPYFTEYNAETMLLNLRS